MIDATHVFSDGSAEDAEDVLTQWEEIKRQKRPAAHRRRYPRLCARASAGRSPRREGEPRRARLGQRRRRP